MSIQLIMKEYVPEQVKACVVVVHGMCEYQNRYVEFATYLKDHGYYVMTYDQIGHGDSAMGEFGYFGKNGWNRLIHCVDQAVQRVKNLYPKVPVYVFGHSMGTIVVRCYLQQHDKDIDGVILSGAPNTPAITKLGRGLANVVCLIMGDREKTELLHQLADGSYSNAIENAETPFDWLSFNRENIDKYAVDPYCQIRFTNRGYADLLEGVDRMHQVKKYQVKRPMLPILFVAGKEDPCIGGVEGFTDSMDTLMKAGYKDISSRLFEASRHEILNDNEKDEVMEYVLEWMEKKLR